MLRVSLMHGFNLQFHPCANVDHYIFAVRKSLEHLVPIVRTDNDIDSVLDRADQSINSIIDLFIKANSGIHVMRAIEPNFRLGSTAIQNYMKNSNEMPHCEYWNTERSDKCIRIASRKQIGDALIKYQDSFVRSETA